MRRARAVNAGRETLSLRARPAAAGSRSPPSGLVIAGPCCLLGLCFVALSNASLSAIDRWPRPPSVHPAIAVHDGRPPSLRRGHAPSGQRARTPVPAEAPRIAPSERVAREQTGEEPRAAPHPPSTPSPRPTPLVARPAPPPVAAAAARTPRAGDKGTNGGRVGAAGHDSGRSREPVGWPGVERCRSDRSAHVACLGPNRALSEPQPTRAAAVSDGASAPAGQGVRFVVVMQNQRVGSTWLGQ